MSTLKITNPATGQLIDEIAADDAAAVAAKAQATRAAQPGWAAVPLAERAAAIARFRAALVAELDTLAATLTREVGKPIAQSRNELNGLLGRIDFFLAQTERSIADEPVWSEGGMRERIQHIPLGVVGNISAWNYPYFVGCNVIVPALLTGNAVLYKPSEFATLTGAHIVRLLHASGVPRQAIQLLAGNGEVGAALLNQKLDGLFFTGSHATGVRIAQALAPRLVKLQLELGGKDPTYVRADADARAAAESLADGAMYNTGQSCCSVERIYVHESLHDAFVEQFVATVQGFKIGDPMDPATYIGAITRTPQLAVLEAQVADAKAKGARLLVGGHRLPGPGNWFAPTVFTNVSHQMELMREESFGPIIGIQKVRGDDEAVALMNDTRYGLTAGVYSKDEARARELLARVNAGSVYWNCCDRVSPRLPWSGHGDSGLGLTLSTHGIQTFTRPKAWHLKWPTPDAA
ncbi:MAG: aldehyde dehydrogenase family protein [Burkholderiaceae bacterium]|nr:aldehyde dehydrogenase family protein [Burkholderiaceae bacterium]